MGVADPYDMIQWAFNAILLIALIWFIHLVLKYYKALALGEHDILALLCFSLVILQILVKVLFWSIPTIYAELHGLSYREYQNSNAPYYSNLMCVHLVATIFTDYFF